MGPQAKQDKLLNLKPHVKGHDFILLDIAIPPIAPSASVSF